mgnify:CR=1 FL=1
MKNIWKLLDKEDKNYFFFMMLLVVICTFLEALSIGLLLPILVTLSDANFFEIYPSFNFINKFLNYPNNLDLIMITIIFFSLIYILKNIFLTFYTIQEGRFCHTIDEKLSKKIFKFYITKNYTFHTKNNSSKMINRIKTDLSDVNLSIQYLLILLSELFIILGIVCLLLILEPKGFMISGLIILISSLMYYFLTTKKIKSLGKEKQKMEALKTKKLLEGFSGIKEIKSFVLENFFLQDYNLMSPSRIKLFTTWNLFKKFPKIFYETVAILGIIVLTITIYLNDEKSNLILPILGIFAASAFRVIPSLNKILSAFQVIKFSSYTTGIVSKDLSNEVKLDNIHVDSVSSEKVNFKKIIRLKNINFKYEDTKDFVFNNLNLEINKNDFVAITGETGSGKSTLVDIILGLLEVENGSIFIDDVNVTKDCSKLREVTGYVPQFTYLFDTSIKKNICLGAKDFKFEDVHFEKCLEICQLKEFVNSLQNNSDTIVGEQAVRLSGGQRQRLGIARALYKKPKILILDEATNALDKETEDKFFRSLIEAKKDLTILFITHKTDLNKNFNKIYKVSNKEITLTYNEK